MRNTTRTARLAMYPSAFPPASSSPRPISFNTPRRPSSALRTIGTRKRSGRVPPRGYLFRKVSHVHGLRLKVSPKNAQHRGGSSLGKAWHVCELRFPPLSIILSHRCCEFWLTRLVGSAI